MVDTTTQPRSGPIDVPGSLGLWLLYPITLLFELPSAFVRFMLTGIVLLVAAWINGQTNINSEGEIVLVAITIFPLVFSASALVYPLGTAWWWRSQTGGRQPSERERLAYDDALAELTSRHPDLRTPTDWFVLDELDTNAMACGDSLALHRGLFESPWLTPILAHELGHLNTIDGKLTVALNRLLAWRRKPKDGDLQRRSGGCLFSLFSLTRWAACGGHSLTILKGAWGTYWRQREYDADSYAARLGEADPLAECLETVAWPYDRPIPFIWLSDASHPSTELRLERLWKQADATPA